MCKRRGLRILRLRLRMTKRGRSVSLCSPPQSGAPSRRAPHTEEPRPYPVILRPLGRRIRTPIPFPSCYAQRRGMRILRLRLRMTRHRAWSWARDQGAPGKRAALFWGEEGQGNERRNARKGVPNGMDFAPTMPRPAIEGMSGSGATPRRPPAQAAKKCGIGPPGFPVPPG